MKNHVGRATNGFTLVEIIVVTAVLSVVFGVASIALVRGSGEIGVSAALTVRERARQGASADGRPVFVSPDSAHVDSPALFLPDGRMLGDATAPWLDESDGGRR